MKTGMLKRSVLLGVLSMSISSVCMAGTDVYGTVDGAGTTDVSQAVSTNASVTVNGTSHDPEGKFETNNFGK